MPDGQERSANAVAFARGQLEPVPLLTSHGAPQKRTSAMAWFLLVDECDHDREAAPYEAKCWPASRSGTVSAGTSFVACIMSKFVSLVATAARGPQGTQGVAPAEEESVSSRGAERRLSRPRSHADFTRSVRVFSDAAQGLSGNQGLSAWRLTRKATISSLRGVQLCRTN